MASAGFIYVLINPSMGSLVKIGKTQRSPEDRVSELSSATGIPTSFHLAYQEYFDDCDKAENYIHEKLKSNRVSDNREFFNAGLNTVIKVIIEAKKIFENDVNENPVQYSDRVGKEATYTGSSKPYDEVYSLASDYLIGFGETIQNIDKAISLFEKAAKMGCNSAYLTLGNIFREETFIKKNLRKATEYYEMGIAQGDNRCWAELARIYLDEDFENFNNWKKCYAKYFSSNDFLNNIEYSNSIDGTSNSLYSSSYIYDTWHWIIKRKITISNQREYDEYFLPIMNLVRNDSVYGEQVVTQCQSGVKIIIDIMKDISDPTLEKILKLQIEYYNAMIKELNEILAKTTNH